MALLEKILYIEGAQISTTPNVLTAGVILVLRTGNLYDCVVNGSKTDFLNGVRNISRN